MNRNRRCTSRFSPEAYLYCALLAITPMEISTTAPLKKSSRGEEGSLRREQDLQDTCPQPFFHPALIPAGYGGPGPEALGQFAPGGAGARYPEHAFQDQTMIDRRAARLRLLRRQEWTKLL